DARFAAAFEKLPDRERRSVEWHLARGEALVIPPGLTSVRRLVIEGADEPLDLALFARLPHLRELQVTRAALSSLDPLASSAALGWLEREMVSHQGPVSLAFMQKLPRLEWIWLGIKAPLLPVDTRPLAGLPALRSLRLEGMTVTDCGPIKQL